MILGNIGAVAIGLDVYQLAVNRYPAAAAANKVTDTCPVSTSDLRNAAWCRQGYPAFLDRDLFSTPVGTSIMPASPWSERIQRIVDKAVRWLYLRGAVLNAPSLATLA